jgi:hypothetical protein
MAKRAMRSCDQCGEAVPAGESRCACGLGCCPFCDGSVLDVCEHLVACDDPDGWWYRSPFEGIEWPHLPEDLEDDNTLSLEDAKRAFGDDAYEIWCAYNDWGSNSFWGEPERGEKVLFRVFAEWIGYEVNEWESGLCGCTSEGFDVWTSDPASVRPKIDAAVARLAEGFRTLEALLRERVSAPPPPPKESRCRPPAVH